MELFLFRPPCAPKPAVLNNTINNGNEGATAISSFWNSDIQVTERRDKSTTTSGGIRSW